MTLKEARQREADLLAEQRTLAQQGVDLCKKAAAEKREHFTDQEKEQESKITAREVEIEGILAETRDRIAQMQRIEERDRLLRPVENDPGNKEPSSEERKNGKFFGSLGEQLSAIYRASIPGGRVDKRLTDVGEFFAVASGLSESVPSDGGFLLQPEYSAELLRKTYEIGEVSRRVRRIPIGANSNSLRINAVDERSRVDGSRWGGVLAYWTNEADSKTGSKPKFRQMELALEKLTCLCYATDELLQDAVALESVLQEAFPEELNFRVEDSIFRGTGAGMPLGFLNSPCKVAVAAEAGQAAATILYENVLNMWSRMWGRSRLNSAWFINQDIEPQLYSMSLKVGTAGSPVYLPPSGASQQPYATLFGRPVIPVEYCSTLGTEGDIVLVDLDQYLMIDKGGVQSASSIHVRFIYDETTFRFVYRCDGEPTWNAPLTPFQGSNTKSPFITLATR